MSTNVAENQFAGEEKVLTNEEVLDVARKITNDQFVRVINYQIDDYSKEKLGMTGSHQRLKLTFQRSNVGHLETDSVFVKSLPKIDANKSADLLYMPILMQESFFFKAIVPQLTYNYVSKRWCPSHYLTAKNAIVMEDLQSSGYSMLEEFVDNPVVLKSVLATLARFHSCSILTEARLTRQEQRPVTLNEYFKGSIVEMMFVQEGEASQWYNCGVNLACALAERLGYNPQKIRSVFDRVYDIVKPSDTYENVICHGDLHIKNIMFTDNSSRFNSILIDFQIIRYAPLVTDILQYLHLNATRKFREQFEGELIQFYHSVLVETINMHDPTIRPPTLENILKGLDDLRTYGLIIACVYIPLALLHTKENKNITDDPGNLFKFLFGDRLERTLAQMSVDKLYKQIVEDAITELAEKAFR